MRNISARMTPIWAAVHVGHFRQNLFAREGVVMGDFYDPDFYDWRIGPGARVHDIYVAAGCELGGPVLDLGCGTGDVLIPLASAGVETCGLDSSERMLGRLRQKLAAMDEAVRSRVTIINAAFEDFELDRRFRQVFIANDTIGHVLGLHPLRNVLSRCFKHLQPGGRLLFDTPQFDVVYLGQHTNGRRSYPHNGGRYDLPDGRAVQVWEHINYETAIGVIDALFHYEFLDARGCVLTSQYRRLRIQPRNREEYMMLLELAGFHDIVVEQQKRGDGYCLDLFVAKRGG